MSRMEAEFAQKTEFSENVYKFNHLEYKKSLYMKKLKGSSNG
jgi:hypothetical protein